jgi:hypothetical protein
MSGKAMQPAGSEWSEQQVRPPPELLWQRVLSRLSSQPAFWLLF